jgi:lipid II:glycine glycyltransferase (peptidoglycan interpeptide bridge formation enzyme)
MNQEPILTLSLCVEEVNEILTGLDYYKKEVEGLSQKIVQVSQIQINEYNKKIQEKQEKTEKEINKKNREGENK